MDNARVKSIRWRAGTIIGYGEMPRYLVEEQRRGDGDVERRHPAPERDADPAIAPVAHEPVEPPALPADHQRHRWGKGDRVVALGPGGVRSHDPYAFGLEAVERGDQVAGLRHGEVGDRAGRGARDRGGQPRGPPPGN